MECHELRNDEVHRRAKIETELASTPDMRVLGWLGHVERMDQFLMAEEC